MAAQFCPSGAGSVTIICSQQSVTIFCSYASCICWIPTPQPLPTSPSLSNHSCILLTKTSNCLPFPWSQACKYSHAKFVFLLEILIVFQLSGCFQITSPLQLKVLWQRQTLARCFAPFMSVLLGFERMLAEYWISSEILQLQWKLPTCRPLCILTVHTQYDFLGRESGSQLLTIASSLFFVNTVLPFLPCEAVGTTSSLEQVAGQWWGKSERDWFPTLASGKERGRRGEKRSCVTWFSCSNTPGRLVLLSFTEIACSFKEMRNQ